MDISTLYSKKILLKFNHEDIQDYDIEELKQVIFNMPFIEFCCLSSTRKDIFASMLISEPNKIKEYLEHMEVVLLKYEIKCSGYMVRYPSDLDCLTDDLNPLYRSDAQPLQVIKFWTKEEFYQKHLKSAKWRYLKNRVFRERGFNCELCNSKKNLQLHHLTYERLGNENDNDVIILCEICHKNAHEKTETTHELSPLNT